MFSKESWEKRTRSFRHQNIPTSPSRRVNCNLSSAMTAWHSAATTKTALSVSTAPFDGVALILTASISLVMVFTQNARLRSVSNSSTHPRDTFSMKTFLDSKWPCASWMEANTISKSRITTTMPFMQVTVHGKEVFIRSVLFRSWKRSKAVAY